MPQRISCFEYCLNATLYLTTKAQFTYRSMEKRLDMACSTKTSDERLGISTVFTFLSVISRCSLLVEVVFFQAASHVTLLEKAHEENLCPLTLQIVANVKLFTLTCMCIHTLFS